MRGKGPRLPITRSSHFRMALWYTALLGIVSLAFGIFVYASQARDIEGQDRFGITKKIEDASKALGNGHAISIQADEAYALFDSEGRVLQIEGMTEQKALELAERASPDSGDAARGKGGHRGIPVSWAADRSGGSMLFGYAQLRGGPRGEPSSGGEGAIAGALLLGSPSDPYGLKSRLLVTLLVALAFMLAAALLSGLWLADRAMKPVAQIARAARSIGEEDLSQRINLRSRDELGEIASVIDSMLDRLEAAFERQKSFVADAGHELRTPLSIMALESDRALSAERDPGEYRRSLEAVRTECGYMSRLVEDLLSLAKADSGSAGRTAWESVDLGVVAEEALERFAPLAGSRGISLSAGELPELMVRGDRRGLARAIGNLLDNAVKYSSEGGHVLLSLEPGDGLAILRVSDDGPGIPPEKLPRVFDRFFRVDESRAEEEGGASGSGLGLAIVKAIAQAHGGRVEARSELRRGSEFSLILPIA